MPVKTQKRKLLWYSYDPARQAMTRTLSKRWSVGWCSSAETFTSKLAQTDVAVIAPPCDDRFDPAEVERLLEAVDMSGAVAVVLLPMALGAEQLMRHRHGQFIPVDAASPPEIVEAMIDAAGALQPVIRDLRADVSAVRGFGNGVARNFQQFDEEMRLAARLQRDFLPQKLPVVGPVHFSTLFRPASWVSGDIYDIFRLDETHVGFYVADVVGHGMPAALLTMFVKKALQTKRISGSSYEIISPDQALSQLNTDICQQNLSSCQFCTAAYGILDTHSLLLRYARGGHPSPVVIRPDGSSVRLDTPGPLLGIFPEESFPIFEFQMSPGDRLVMFSDGAEDTLACPHSDLVTDLRNLRRLGGDELVLNLTALLEERRAVNQCDDDVTVLVMDVQPKASHSQLWHFPPNA